MLHYVCIFVIPSLSFTCNVGSYVGIDYLQLCFLNDFQRVGPMNSEIKQRKAVIYIKRAKPTESSRPDDVRFLGLDLDTCASLLQTHF